MIDNRVVSDDPESKFQDYVFALGRQDMDIPNIRSILLSGAPTYVAASLTQL